jgi:4'-phosphopantetheinyl transferase
VWQHDVGVDVEAGARLGDPLPLARRFFAAREAGELAAATPEARRARFLELWVLKEAVLKARGVGLAGQLASVTFVFEGEEPRLVSSGAPDDEAAGWQVALRQPTARHRLAVAVRRGARPDLRLVMRGP